MKSVSDFKTINKLSEIKLVNNTLTSATEYYDKLKSNNMFLRTSFSVFEFSFKTMTLIASPIASVCKRPRRCLC